MRYFTVREAESLLPELERVLGNIYPAYESVKEKSRRIAELEASSRPAAAEIALERAQLQFLVSGIDEWLAKIVEMGAVPKGLEPALVDFPARLGSRDVYLCWKAGERRITHYLGLDEDFAGRKPLPPEDSPATA